MHPRGHELVHIRSMNWVQSTFITCHAFLFFARTSFDILDHLTVSSTTLHRKRPTMVCIKETAVRHKRGVSYGIEVTVPGNFISRADDDVYEYGISARD